MLKASDIYGSMGMGASTTQDDTKPAQNQAESKKANDQAKGKPLSNTYGTIAILALLGILIGSKFALEKPKK